MCLIILMAIKQTTGIVDNNIWNVVIMFYIYYTGMMGVYDITITHVPYNVVGIVGMKHVHVPYNVVGMIHVHVHVPY